MFSDILTLALSVIGIISVFYSAVFRITASLTDELNIVVPLYSDEENIHSKIYRLNSLFDFCHIKNKCTIVLVNYGASECYCNSLREMYSEYKEFILLDPYELKGFFKE